VRPEGPGQSNASNRMQAFENEKRRIYDSCFSKVDEDGTSKHSAWSAIMQIDADL